MRILAAALLWVAFAAAAQTVSLSGRLGDKALLMIDGSARTLSVGSTVQGVKLLSVNAEGAVVEVAGQRMNLRIGGTQVNLGGAASDGGGTRIVLTASEGGHFIGNGAINGRTVQFIVDTGATSVSISQADAERIGLKYRDSPRAMAQTANGAVPVHRVMLDTVRVGEVQVYHIEALVIPATMSYVLLGNSFLSRFQMKRENDVLTLEKRP